jgi:prophage antirepressor-like protein
MQSQKNEVGTLLPMRVFTFNESNMQVHVEVINNEPWFVASDLCAILGLSNTTEAIRGLDDDERLTSEILRAGQRREVNLVSESGMYALVIRSNKPIGKKLRKWVTSEVLPSIRKTGGYKIGQPQQRKYIKRGEGLNTQTMQLLWVVNEYLNQGDRNDIALQLGVSRQAVYNTLSGNQRSGRILHACYQRALANREQQNSIYFATEAAYENLVHGTNNSLRPILPAEPDHGRRGGQPGNQNARKEVINGTI